MKNKNFCATISETFSTELDALAAKFGIKTKAQLLSFLAEQTLQNIAAKDAPRALRTANVPYLLECYICAALNGDAPISKKDAQNYISERINTARVNSYTIDTVLAPYAKEIAAHAAAHNYAENTRFVKFLAVLNDINLQSK
jgi:hypothetical protein